MRYPSSSRPEERCSWYHCKGSTSTFRQAVGKGSRARQRRLRPTVRTWQIVRSRAGGVQGRSTSTLRTVHLQFRRRPEEHAKSRATHHCLGHNGRSGVAQLAERPLVQRRVVGSIPTPGADRRSASLPAVRDPVGEVSSRTPDDRVAFGDELDEALPEHRRDWTGATAASYGPSVDR